MAAALLIIIAVATLSTQSDAAFLPPRSSPGVLRRVDGNGAPSLPVAPLRLKRGGTKKKKAKSNTITVNKLAFRNYEVLETWEAGISLVGTEVKR